MHHGCATATCKQNGCVKIFSSIVGHSIYKASLFWLPFLQFMDIDSTSTLSPAGDTQITYSYWVDPIQMLNAFECSIAYVQLSLSIISDS